MSNKHRGTALYRGWRYSDLSVEVAALIRRRHLFEARGLLEEILYLTLVISRGFIKVQDYRKPK